MFFLERYSYEVSAYMKIAPEEVKKWSINDIVIMHYFLTQEEYNDIKMRVSMFGKFKENPIYEKRPLKE